jgi:predicted ATPase
MVHFPLRDRQTVAAHAEELFSLTSEYGIRAYLPHAIFYRAWAMATPERAEQGFAEMRQAVASTKVAASYAFPPMLTALAETCCECGHAAEGLVWVAEGLRVVEDTGERGMEGELYRIKGELLLVQDSDNEAQAEGCFRTAIDIARGRAAKFPELRATTRLARLLERQGKTEEASTMLAEIYNWFTEGFDTADLKDAKALLEELTR